MTTPIQRLTRLLSEGARFKVELPGQLSIDLTPDVIAALDSVQIRVPGDCMAGQLTCPSMHAATAKCGEAS
jgi:hypothetical protein